VARQLGRPHGRLEAEGDRQPRLPVGASEHHGAAVTLGEAEQRPMDLAQVPLGDCEHALHQKRGPCVGHVLDGQAVADPLPRVSGELALQHADQPEHRVPATARLIAHRREVERVRGVRGDLARRRLGDQPELALGRRQLTDDA
jgi:hypothetical protein